MLEEGVQVAAGRSAVPVEMGHQRPLGQRVLSTDLQDVALHSRAFRRAYPVVEASMVDLVEEDRIPPGQKVSGQVGVVQ